MFVLTKKEHKPWKKPWFEGGLHPERGSYIWNERQQARLQWEKTNELPLFQLEASEPPDDAIMWGPPRQKTLFEKKSDKFICYPDDICLGIDVKQDAQSITAQVHFDKRVLDFITDDKCPIEKLLACDVWEDHFYIFLHGDEQNPIFWGMFSGVCVPEASSWKMVDSDLYRERQKELSEPSPALQVKIVKDKGHTGKWTKIFTECWQHELIIHNWDQYENCKAIVELSDWWDRKERGELDADAEAPQERPPADSLAYAHQFIGQWVAERWPGYREAQTLARSGKDFNDPHYWGNVDNFVEGQVKRNGYSGGAKWNEKLGRFSYMD